MDKQLQQDILTATHIIDGHLKPYKGTIVSVEVIDEPSLVVGFVTRFKVAVGDPWVSVGEFEVWRKEVEVLLPSLVRETIEWDVIKYE